MREIIALAALVTILILLFLFGGVFGVGECVFFDYLVTADEFEQIDAGEIAPPKPGIRHRSALSRSLQHNQPLQDYDPENDQIERYEELAGIVANGGITG